MEIKLKDFNALLNFNLGHYICSLCGLYVDPRAHRVFQQALECGQDPHLQPVTYVLYFLNNAKRESINISSLLTMITLLPMNPKVFFAEWYHLSSSQPHYARKYFQRDRLC